MRTASNRYIIAREHNVVRVDFSRKPDPPAPRFPGANAMRQIIEDAGEPVFACASRPRHSGTPRAMLRTS